MPRMGSPPQLATESSTHSFPESVIDITSPSRPAVARLPIIGLNTRSPYDLAMTRVYMDDTSAERLNSLQEQNLELSRLIAELRNEAALRTQFLSNISHDLRTPLTAIITHGEILRDGILGALTPRQKARELNSASSRPSSRCARSTSRSSRRRSSISP